MAPTVVDLCSSPELDHKRVSSFTEQTSIIKKSHPVSSPLSPEWHELSSDFSDKVDPQSLPEKIDSLPLISSIAEKHPICGSSNEIIDLVSDDLGSEKYFVSDNSPAIQIDGKDNPVPVLTLNSLDSPRDEKSLLGIGSADKYNLSQLCDPFNPSPAKKRCFSSSTDTHTLTASIPTAELHSSPLNDFNNVVQPGLLKDAGSIAVANKMVLDFDPSDFLSSPNTYDLLDIEVHSKTKNTFVLSDDENDDEWIRELLDTNSEGKGGKKKKKSIKLQSGLRQREKGQNCEILSEYKGIAKPRVDHDSSNGHKMKELNTINTEKKNYKITQNNLELQKEKAKARDLKKSLKSQDKLERNRLKELNAAIVKSNQLKDRLESTLEMIVDIPLELDVDLAHQVKIFLEGVNAKYDTYNCSSNMIKWRRKVQTEWDPLKGHWQPITERIQDEKYVMCILKARDLVTLIRGEEGHDLNAYILKLKVECSNKEIIFLVEGMKSWFNKNKATKNKIFMDAVRNQVPNAELSSSNIKRRCKKSEQEYIDQSIIDVALIKIHVVYQVLIHHTQNLLETAEWVMRFTQHISTLPYR